MVVIKDLEYIKEKFIYLCIWCKLFLPTHGFCLQDNDSCDCVAKQVTTSAMTFNQQITDHHFNFTCKLYLNSRERLLLQNLIFIIFFFESFLL